MRTSSDSAYSSTPDNFSLLATAVLTVTSTTVSPNTINASASYAIEFITGLSGALALGDQIILTFPSNTFVPANVGNSLITINGNPLSTPAIGNQVLRTLTIQSPVAIGNVVPVTILISSTAGILSPSVSGSYTLQLRTTAEPGDVTSPSYSITPTTTTITTPSVTPSVFTPSATANYLITFNTGNFGRLNPGVSTITLVFPAGTTVPASPTTTVNTFTASASAIGQTLTITVPTDALIANNGAVTVQVNGLTNPLAGNYTLNARTSVESTPITSAPYPISGVSPTIVAASLAIGTDTVNVAGSYSIQFTTAATTQLSVTFPEGTIIPITIPNSAVTVTGTSVSSVVTNPSTRVVTVTTTSAVTAATMTIGTAATIINPPIRGSVTLQFATGAAPAPVSSAPIPLNGSRYPIQSPSLTVFPEATFIPVEWRWTFTTSATGRLAPGISTATIELPLSVTVPTTISPSTVTVNGVPSPSVVTGPALFTMGGTAITISVPTSVTVSNSSSLSITISSGAGIFGNQVLISTLGYTSVDTTVATLPDTPLPVELVGFSVMPAKGVRTQHALALEWKTASETENAGFILYRSTSREDGYTQLESFNDNEALRGMGTSSTGRVYRTLDQSVRPGQVYYYKLADVNFAGVQTFHSVIEGHVPFEFELSQNYPNPFNPNTQIAFQLPERGLVELNVYDVLGRKVATVLNQTLDAGAHQIRFQSARYGLSSGVYFYRLNASNRSATKKMVLLK